MILWHHSQSLLARLLRSPIPAVAAGFCSGILLAGTPAQVAGRAAQDDIFHSTNLLRIAIEIPEEGIRTLRQYPGRHDPQGRAEVPARVLESNTVYTNVAVHLKGVGSSRPIDQMPSLTLDFDKFAPKQKFHGLTKISLNNSAQDSTCLNEKLSRELFAAAGVPVPRADHAVVTLNGRALGLYVLTEGYSKQFLKRYFKRNDGNLYDGGFLLDIDRPLEVNSGKNRADRSDLKRLITATREPDPAKRFSGLERMLDMDRFLSMVAMETILCHWDSYSMNRSNYRIYHDPETDRMVFMPHGMDRVLGGFQPNLDLPVVPPMRGIVARAVISTPEGRRRHIERVGVLFTNLFRPEQLCQRIREIDAKIAPEMMHPETRWALHSQNPLWDVLTSGSHTQDVAALCARIAIRATHLKEQFALPREMFSPAPRLEFGAAGVAQIEGWKPKHMDDQVQVACETTNFADKEVLHVVLPPGAKSASLRRRVTLPAGQYRLLGKVKAAGMGDAGVGSSIPAVMVHYSGNRFGSEIQPVDWTDLAYDFEVVAGPALEEVELIFDLRKGPGEVWFDSGSLRLSRPEH